MFDHNAVVVDDAGGILDYRSAEMLHRYHAAVGGGVDRDPAVGFLVVLEVLVVNGRDV